MGGMSVSRTDLSSNCLSFANGPGNFTVRYFKILTNHCFPGHMAVGGIPRHTPISAFAWNSTTMGIQLRIYWHDVERNLMELAWSGGWRPVTKATYMGNSQLSAVQWQDGTHIRAYYQGSDRSILEKCISNTSTWFNGSRVDAPEEVDAASRS